MTTFSKNKSKLGCGYLLIQPLTLDYLRELSPQQYLMSSRFDVNTVDSFIASKIVDDHIYLSHHYKFNASYFLSACLVICVKVISKM